MKFMFAHATNFNQDISEWNVSKAKGTNYANFAPDSSLEDKHNPFYGMPTAIISGFELDSWDATQQVEVKSISVGFDKNTVTYEWREGKNNLDGKVLSTASSFTYKLENFGYDNPYVYLTLTVKDASGAVSTTTRYFWTSYFYFMDSEMVNN